MFKIFLHKNNFPQKLITWMYIELKPVLDRDKTISIWRNADIRGLKLNSDRKESENRMDVT